MPLRATVDLTRPNSYLGRTRILLAVVMVVVLALLPLVVARAFHLSELVSATRLEVTDDETWVTSQLEVDYLKLSVAVRSAVSFSSVQAPEAGQKKRWAEVLKRFDIFYSRVDAVANKVRTWSDDPPDWDLPLLMLDDLLVHRNQIATIVDAASDLGGQVDVYALEAAVEATGPAARELSVATLGILSRQTTERRLEYVAEFRAVLIQTVSMLLVMALTSLTAWLLYRQIGDRVATEQRLNENLNRVFDAKPEAILVIDPNQWIIWTNRSAADLFGFSEAEAQGDDALALFSASVQRRAR